MGRLMTTQQHTIADLFREVLDERKALVTYTNAETEAAVVRLRERFDRVRAAAALRREVEIAVRTLPEARSAGWLSGAQAALRVVMSEVRRSSTILTDIARDILPLTQDAWSFGAGMLATTRGEGTGVRRAESEPANGEPQLSVVLDDFGSERRVIATIRDFPHDRLPPVMLVVPDADTNGQATEVDAEIIAETGSGIEAVPRRLRYEATLQAGAYSIFFGNARAPGAGAPPG
jgi:hypothetical protein